MGYSHVSKLLFEEYGLTSIEGDKANVGRKSVNINKDGDLREIFPGPRGTFK